LGIKASSIEPLLSQQPPQTSVCHLLFDTTIKQEQSTLTLRITKYNFVIKSIQNKIIKAKRFTQSILDKNT